MKINDRRMAILIDADNVSDRYINFIIEEVSNYGIPTYKRIYGDFTKSQMNKWKQVLLNHSITPIQQFAYTQGKNSTDSSLIIDAMDILYSGKVDGFCIVSSDSDFTRLASRLREAGMFVLGIGEKKTPQPFISACEKFTFVEVLIDTSKDDQDFEGKDQNLTYDQLKSLVTKLITELSDGDGYVFLGEIGNLISKRYPSFDTRNYGYQKLTPLLNSFQCFEIKDEPTSNSSVVHKYIKLRKE